MAVLRQPRRSERDYASIQVFKASNMIHALGGRQSVGGFVTANDPKFVAAIRVAAEERGAINNCEYVIEVEEYGVWMRQS